MKPVFNMIGGGFLHAPSSCGWEHPKYIEWNKKDQSASVSVYIDSEVLTPVVDKSKFNIAWFCESPWINRRYTQHFDNLELKEKLLSNFDLIFSCDKEFIEKHPEVKYLLPHAFTWCKDRNVFPKIKMWSIIASGKTEAPGHKLRHLIVDTYKDHLSVFGSGYKKIDSKNEGLNDFRFSFAIENVKVEGYWTEKIVDCFATGTIPIYWGANSVSEYFLEDGIVRINDEFDLSVCNEDFYKSKLDVIKENFDRAINLPLPEDYIYLHYLK
jgi:hypothetical protein